MPATATERSREITRKSRSNLAFALACLPRQRRRDMVTLYAFCRVVDDIADNTGLNPACKRRRLDLWQRWVLSDDPQPPDPAADGGAGHDADADLQLARELAALPQRYPIDRALFVEVIDGMRMDIEPRLYRDWDELRRYCYRVASAVGLLSIEVFGYRDPACRTYAEQLGYALQITNIMRDVGADLEQGRVYLPLADLDAHGYTLDDLKRRVHDARFTALMDRQWHRAMNCHETALSHLPEGDRANMLAAEMMAQIYQELLASMRADNYRVFDRRYSVRPLRKAVILLGYNLRALLRTG